ncbi:MAG: hypothetical protein MPN21_26460 [Thermoanaerobaculia bacterium]|nr:hypothetical protein [Thermoanaerobaculia bacterium]
MTKRKPLVGSLVVTSGLLFCLLSGCASTRPGTGDLSFRLLWDGSADLDLHAEDPHGRHVGTQMSFASAQDAAALRRQLAEYTRLENELDHVPKGILDVDCNADPERMCKRPIENIFWPTGTAPRGTYEVWVHHFQNVTGDDGVPYFLEIRRGERVVQTIRGTVAEDDPTSERISVDY